jgi:hypothetical protein
MAPGSPMKAPATSTPPQYASLSPARQRLVDVLWELQFGRIEGLVITEGDPQFDPPHPAPTIIQTIKLPVEARPPEPGAADSLLKQQIVDLFQHFARQQTGMVRRLEFRFGLPCLVEIVAGDVDGRISERATPRRTT